MSREIDKAAHTAGMQPGKPAHLRDDLKFKPGQSGNPAGKPKGARNKLGEEFIEALFDDFKVHGPNVIARVRQEKPDAYLKVVASLLPREINLKTPLEELTDEQLTARIRQLAVALGLALAEEEDQSSRVH